MQTKERKKKPVQEVKKPILIGSWHGKDAFRLALKRLLSVLAVSMIYLIAGVLLGFESLWARVLSCVAIVGLATYYQFFQGINQGQSDASFGEIMYARQEDGRGITKEDRERCFHPFKGMFAALLGAAPYVAFALVFACITRQNVYVLGVLPSWTEGMLAQSEFGEALAYYGTNAGLSAVDIMRVIDRAMIMPFVNVATSLGDYAALMAERLSPLLVLVAPLGYGVGYMQGQKVRNKINTGIQMGDEKKRRRERKARKQRQRSKSPERLI